MTTQAAFIAVDWGTSNARFALCDEDGQTLEMRDGPGAAQSRGRFAEVFDEATSGWRAQRDLPTWMCGMVGSAFGWAEAPYLPCPADLSELADSAVKIRDGVHVLPGMSCTNPLGAPDVMRGEETQLFGALCLGLLKGDGRQLVCMPGTHTKWVSLSGGVVQEFLTAPTGEIFALLCEHSVLVRDKATPVTHVPRDFERGLAEAARHPGSLVHQIFQARSLRLDRQLSAEGAASWASGLLIGADVAGALAMFDQDAPVLIIGAPRLAECYSLALAGHGRRAAQVDGSKASLAGLGYVFREQERPRA